MLLQEKKKTEEEKKANKNTLNRESRERMKRQDLDGFRKRANESQYSYRERKKEAVYNHYSNGTNRCAVCGESRIACLSIDHIRGGGTKHKSTLRLSGGDTFYRWLIRNNYPKGYQILCMNCQFVKRVMNNEVVRGEMKCQHQ